MSSSRTTWLTAAAIAVAVGGCGGSTKTATEHATAPASQTTSTAAVTQAATTPAATPAKASGLTAMGTTLKLGQPAVIAYDDSSNHKKSRIEVTPQKIEKGTISDFKNIKLEGKEK